MKAEYDQFPSKKDPTIIKHPILTNDSDLIHHREQLTTILILIKPTIYQSLFVKYDSKMVKDYVKSIRDEI